MLAQVMKREYPLWLMRVLRITLFTVIIVIGAKLNVPIPGTPVPITLQVLSIVLAGFVLGPVEGAISAAVYVGSIWLNLPFDAAGQGTAVLFGATAGYLVSYPLAAFVAGLSWRVAERYKLYAMIGTGILAVIVIYVFGVLGLLPFYGGNVIPAIGGGVVPFIGVDLAKVLLAASLVKLGHESWLRWMTPGMDAGLKK